MRVLIAVLSVLGILFGVLMAIGLVGHDAGLGVLLAATGAICFTIAVGTNDVVEALDKTTKAIDELRKMNNKMQ